MIWIVTDHADTRSTLPGLISAEGYEIAEIDCNEEVLRRLRFQTPKLIILDCGLPDSFETLATIRKQDRAGRIPVVMFSLRDGELRERALLSGADAYVPKGSMDWAELLAQVARYVGPPEEVD